VSIAPLKFTGVSTYSADLQTVLNRAVSIASIPLNALQNEATDNLQRKTMLGSFNSALGNLESSLRSLGTVASQKALSASSSNSSKVSVTYAGASAATSYTISEITSVAKSASETTVSGYANSTSAPVSSTGTIKLVIGSKEKEIVLGAGKNNLVGVRDAINALGLGVTATILTTGSGANPNFLSLTADTSGAKTLALYDDPTGANTNLITAANQGADAEFKLNGVAVKRSSNQVNDVVSGLVFTIKEKTDPGETINLTLSTDRSRLSRALASFAEKYNAVVDQVNGQVGPSAGLLSGDFIIREAQNILRKLSSYEGDTVGGLANLGLEFSSDGKLELNSEAFNALSETQISESFGFLGSATTGFAALSKDLAQLSDPLTGLVKRQLEGYDRTDLRLQEEIAKLEERISYTQASVAERLQVADALLAQLQSQQSILDASLKSVSLALFGKNEE
jgi:flagellar hook-associated protein 2